MLVVAQLAQTSDPGLVPNTCLFHLEEFPTPLLIRTPAYSGPKVAFTLEIFLRLNIYPYKNLY